MTIFHLNLIGYEYYTYPPKFKDDGSTIMYKWRKLYLNINTIRKRIDKINSMISLDWNNHVQRLEMELLLQFLDL